MVMKKTNVETLKTRKHWFSLDCLLLIMVHLTDFFIAKFDSEKTTAKNLTRTILMTYVLTTNIPYIQKVFIAWKLYVVVVITSYLSVFSPNAGKYGPELLRIQILFYAVSAVTAHKMLVSSIRFALNERWFFVNFESTLFGFLNSLS